MQATHLSQRIRGGTEDGLKIALEYGMMIMMMMMMMESSYCPSELAGIRHLDTSNVDIKGPQI